MLNSVYQLISPKIISIKYQDISFDDEVLVRPNYLALCHADQRYYQGKRDAKVLRKKLPMALIHEGWELFCMILLIHFNREKK